MPCFSPPHPFLNTQIPSFSSSTQRNKSKAALPSAAQLCMRVSFYTWKTVYFCFSSINARACLLPHQASPDSWDATFLTGKSLTHTQNTPTDGLLLFPPSLWSHSDFFFFFFGLFLGRRGMFRLFVVVFATEITAGSEVTNLSDCKDTFKHTHTEHTAHREQKKKKKSRATWSWIPLRVSGEPLVFDDHCRRQMHSGWGKRRSRGGEEITMRRLTKTVRMRLRNMNH